LGPNFMPKSMAVDRTWSRACIWSPMRFSGK
jgi:hypothetical protein